MGVIYNRQVLWTCSALLYVATICLVFYGAGQAARMKHEAGAQGGAPTPYSLEAEVRGTL